MHMLADGAGICAFGSFVDASGTWPPGACMVLRVVAVLAEADLGAAVAALVGVDCRQALLAAGNRAARFVVHLAVVLRVAAAGGVPVSHPIAAVRLKRWNMLMRTARMLDRQNRGLTIAA